MARASEARRLGEGGAGNREAAIPPTPLEVKLTPGVPGTLSQLAELQQ